MKVWVVEDSPSIYESSELVAVVDDFSKALPLYRKFAEDRLSYLKGNKFFPDETLQKMIDRAVAKDMRITDMEVQ